MNIGILEDNPAILDFVATALEMHGHTVYTHTFGTSLLQALFDEGRTTSALPYDLVIVDLLLPGSLSGLEVCTTIRHVHPEFPLILISGVAQDILERFQMRLPQVPVVRKPFKIAALLQVIEERAGQGAKAVAGQQAKAACSPVLWE